MKMQGYWGERVYAVPVLIEGAGVTGEEIAFHSKPLIPNHKRPKAFEVRDATLPLLSLAGS